MEEDLFKIVGIIIVGFFVIYMVLKMFKLQKSVVEGLTNADTITPVSGEAGTAAEYAAGIKARLVKLQDELLVGKYRNDYEAAIINLDDYIGYLMIQQTLNMKFDGDIKLQMESINNLNILKNAKESLNATMAYLDKQ
jgi:hypothetical protein